MSLIKNPNELTNVAKLAILFYGQPGVGKTTIALSAPNPVLIDADKGIHRVKKRFQTPSLPLDNYKDFLDLLEGTEIDPFESIVVDTLGRLIDMMGDYLGRENPKNKNSDGSLSLKGYGAVRTEFQRLLRLVKAKNKFMIFVAHEREEKDGDIRIVRPDVSGSSGKDLVKDLDLMGYMQMRGQKFTISFCPSEHHYAKNGLNLPAEIVIPDPSVAGNDFIPKFIINKCAERMKEDDEQNKKYDEVLASVDGVFSTVKDGKTADEALATINMAPVIWDSQRVMKTRLQEAVTKAGLTYDKATKKFVVAPPKEEPAPEAKPGEQSGEAKQQTTA